jgi:hypothetical protein
VNARFIPSLFLFTIVVVSARAAPAPWPKTNEAGAEIVFDGGTGHRARLAVNYLHSRQCLDHLRQSGIAPQLSASLSERLSVTWEDNLVCVHLRGGSGTVAALRALVARLSRELPADWDKYAKQRLFEQRDAVLRAEYDKQTERQQKRKQEILTEAFLKEVLATFARYEFEAEPLKVSVAPRLVARCR